MQRKRLSAGRTWRREREGLGVLRGGGGDNGIHVRVWEGGQENCGSLNFAAVFYLGNRASTKAI